MLSGFEMRELDPYRVDPLSEEWRWQRIRALEIGSVSMAVAAPDGTLVVLGNGADVSYYDGYAFHPLVIPAEFGVEFVNSMGITRSGTYCLIGNDAIVLHHDGDWVKVSDYGLSRRALDSIIETEDGILWAGVDGGIARIDPLNCTSEKVPSQEAVLSICEGPERKSLWVAKLPYGEVWEYPLNEAGRIDEATRIQRGTALRTTLLRAKLLRASDGRIWYINDNHNLPSRVYDPMSDQWQVINLSRIGGDNFNFSILETPDGAIWISSRGTLHIMRDGEWKVYHSPDYPLPGARSSMVQSPSGHVMIIEQSGINVRVDYGQQQGLSFSGLHFQDRSEGGELFFISIDDEVVRWVPGSLEAQFHPAETTGITTPTAFHLHSNGDWLLSGSHEQQAAVAIYHSGQWERYLFPEVGLTFGHLALHERPNGDVWLGCAQMEVEFPGYQGGMVVFSPDGKGGYSIARKQPPAFEFRNWSLQAGPGGKVYTSGNGLFEITPDGAISIGVPQLIQYKWIDQISVDSMDVVWAAVWSVGVFRRERGAWTQYGEAEGLESNLISFVLTLDDEHPVAATQAGYFRFDGIRWAPFMSPMEGLYRGSGKVAQARDGSIWINHTHVDWYYRGQRTEAYPDEKRRNFSTVQYIPDLQGPVVSWTSTPPELFRNTNLRFQWRGRDAWSRTPSQQLKFSYRIDGGDWSPFSSANELFLSELKGGKHSIEVRARDDDFNISMTPLHAEFSVILPLWQQAWFISSLLIGIAFLLAVVALFIRQRVRHVLEIEQVKMRFFTHLSHEIKTPLTLILGPVERLQNELTDGRQQHYLSLIKSNSQRLLFLVNQLLDLSKFKLSHLEYKPEEADFIPFARSCLSVFDEWIREKNQTIVFESSLHSFIFAFPHEIFHKVIDNLVNNAIKYTPRDGRILLRLELAQGEGGNGVGILEVEDSGPGVPASEQQAVFEPFYRSTAHDKSIEGSGIGLAFVKELIQSIGGSIELISPVNAQDPLHPGCLFRVTFPIGGATVKAAADQPALTTAPQDVVSSEKEANGDAAGGLILLVEDNLELRDFISGELRELARVETADSVETGFAKAKELIPDIVISDVVMPLRNGFELCSELKKDPHTSHIPVVLLTALRSERHKREGYQSGADDFITKPVSPEILRLKLRNILATQQQSRDRVRHQFVDDNRVTGLSDADQAFLDKVRAVVESELSSEQFDVNALASKMGFSRSAFYRKFNSLTDLSPAAFIRTKRLRQAAQWLAEGSKSVSEIAFDVGFSDPGYFSRVFKDEYNCSPSEFARKS